MMSWMICTAHPLLFGWTNLEEWDGLGMWHVWRRGAYRALMGKPERKRLGRRRRRREDNIKMDLQEVGCGDWIKLAQDRDRWRALVNVMNLRFPSNAGSFLTSWEPVSFSRRTQLHEVRKQCLETTIFVTFVSLYWFARLVARLTAKG